MDFEDSGIDSDQKIDNNSDFIGGESREPIISFSPNRSRFDTQFPVSGGVGGGGLGGSSKGCGGTDPASNILSFSDTTTSLVVNQDSGPSCLTADTSDDFGTFPDAAINVTVEKPLIDYSPKLELKQQTETHQPARKSNGKGVTFVTGSTASTTDLQKRLEKRIARANSSSQSYEPHSRNHESSVTFQGGTSSYSSARNKDHRSNIIDMANGDSPVGVEHDEGSLKLSKNAKFQGDSMNSSVPKSSKDIAKITVSSSTASSNYGDGRKAQLLPPQRLAIPNKSSQHTSSIMQDGSQSESKPLVEWESDESEEEELTFFPNSRKRGTLTDNLSIDNMSLSGEEDDLHLSPPRPLSYMCPCDPRLLIDSRRESRKKCAIL